MCGSKFPRKQAEDCARWSTATQSAPNTQSAMLYSLDVGRRFRPPEGRMRRVIFQKSLLRKNSTTRPSEAVGTREPKYFFSFRGLTCPRSLKNGCRTTFPRFLGFFQNRGQNASVIQHSQAGQHFSQAG